MTKTIVVLGVTGIQGGSVASKFLQEPNWRVRGVTRNASSAAAKALIAKGVEIVTADLDNQSSWDGVLNGAHAIFAITDFWAKFTEAYPRLSKESKRATGEYASAEEIRRARTVVDAASKILKDEGLLEIFIYSSLPSYKELSGGKYTYVYHYDAKAQVNKYIEAEHPELYKRTSIFNMGLYYTNMISSPLFAPQKGADGTYTLRITCSKDALQPLVYPGDTGELAALLVRSSPGKNLLAVSDWKSYSQYLAYWSEVTGKPSRAVQVSIQEFDDAFPGGLGREVGESMLSSAEMGYGKDMLLPQDIDPDVKLTSLREYVGKENWGRVLNGSVS